MAKKEDNKNKKEEAKKVHMGGTKGGQRVKVVEIDLPTPTASETVSESGVKTRTSKTPRGRSKRYKEVKARIDKNKAYAIDEAIKLVKETSYSKFDGTMEAHIQVKKKGLSVNVTLPFAGGRSKKVEVANAETIEKLKAGKIDFDVLLSTAEMMPQLVPFARLLGPKGMMPNPKNGTLIKSEADANKFSANSMTVKTEKEAPLMHTTFGKVSQKNEELSKNLETLLEAVNRKQIVRIYIKSTMSPSVRLSL